MDIRWEKGKLALNSEHANYSFNQLHEVFQKALCSIGAMPTSSSKILNLGMGAGSTVSIIREELGWKNPIISIEIDPQIIAVAKSHFTINRFKNHQILQSDASVFLETNPDVYGLILVDVFRDRTVADRFQSRTFFDTLDAQLETGGSICFNYLDTEQHPMEQWAEQGELKMIQWKNNRVLIYRKTDKS